MKYYEHHVDHEYMFYFVGEIFLQNCRIIYNWLIGFFSLHYVFMFRWALFKLKIFNDEMKV